VENVAFDNPFENRVALGMQRGDERAIRIFFTSGGEKLWAKFKYKYGLDDVTSEDLAATCLISCFHKIARFTPLSEWSFAGWVAQMAYFTLLNHLRDKRIKTVPFDPEINLTQADSLEPNLEVISLVEWLFQHLPEVDCDVIRLRFLENFSHKDIADKLGLTELAARQKLCRAVQKLKALRNSRQLKE
jgi:RNA polymerase sigma-70 factor, ECF subfamily